MPSIEALQTRADVVISQEHLMGQAIREAKPRGKRRGFMAHLQVARGHLLAVVCKKLHHDSGLRAKDMERVTVLRGFCTLRFCSFLLTQKPMVGSQNCSGVIADWCKHSLS